MRRVAGMIAGALAVAGAGLVAVAAGSESKTSAPLPVPEIDMKAHLADAVEASSDDLGELRLNPGDTFRQILLTAFENGRGGHYLMRLRDGAHAVTIPYFPIYGNLFVTGSLLPELDLRFDSFDAVTGDKRPQMAGPGGMSDAVATRPEDGIAPITDPVRQERLAWGLERLPDTAFSSSTYFTSRAWDRHFTQPREPGGRMAGKLVICDQVSVLEQGAGITP